MAVTVTVNNRFISVEGSNQGRGLKRELIDVTTTSTVTNENQDIESFLANPVAATICPAGAITTTTLAFFTVQVVDGVVRLNNSLGSGTGRVILEVTGY